MATPYLHTYRCSHCRSTLTTSARDRHRKCILCLRLMRYEFSVPVQTEDEWAIYRKGEVFNGGDASQVAEPWTCVRCGGEFSGADRPKYRVDGKACRECVAAERPQSWPLQTEEQIRLDRARRDARELENQARLEAAYRAAEGR